MKKNKKTNKKDLEYTIDAIDITASDLRASDIFENYETSEFKKIVIDKL